MYNSNSVWPPRAPAGFTLIELMVVMLIIGLLASILVPSLGHVRESVKTSASKTLIFTLEQGLSMFRSDETLGNDFPPSRWPASGLMVGNDDPYGSSGSGGNYVAWGTQTLVWAVVGAKLTGTHRFPITAGLLQAAYAGDGSVGARGPFVDPSKLEILRLDDAKCAANGKYDTAAVHVEAPVILDVFGMPILYYKPDKGTTSTAILDKLPRAHNAPFTEDPDASSISNLTTDQLYNDFFKDTRAAAWGNRPHNYDTFVLLGAGVDKKYGTADDTANFPLNELP